MNPITKAIDELNFRIPYQILFETFKEPQNWRAAPLSLTEQILNKVIRPRVLVDANLVGGIMMNVPLEGIAPDFIDAYTSVYHIPKDRTQNRTIVAALSIGYMPMAASYNAAGGGYGNIAPQSMNELTSAMQRVADSVSGVPPISNAYVELIAENTILMRDQFRVTAAYFLRCIVGNEQNLNNLSPRSYIHFSKLCELAVKSFIYNTMLIKIDQAFLSGGQELGAFKNYVESLSDAEENYQTYLRENWQSVSIMNDPASYSRLLKLQVNPGI